MSESTPPTRRERKAAPPDIPDAFVPPRPAMPAYPGAPVDPTTAGADASRADSAPRADAPSRADAASRADSATRADAARPATTAGSAPAPGSAPATPWPAASVVPADDLDDHRLPTAQLEMAAFGPHPVAGEWLPAAPPQPKSVAPWALGFAVVALAGSLFVGWLLPVGLVAVILAIVSLRRTHDSRRVAVWALVLGAVSVAYSAGWLLWAR